MFTCKGTALGLSAPHAHEAVSDAKRCYGLMAPSVPPVPTHTVAPVSGPVMTVFGSRHNPTGPLSQSQFNYIRDLRGDTTYALALSYYDASTYIARLKGATRVTQPPVTDPRLDMLKSLFPLVRDGYYAAREYDGGHIDFIRISSPKKNRLAGARKIQSIVGNGFGYKLTEAAVLWPSNQWSIYDRSRKVLDNLMLICADPTGAAILYAEHLGNCCRCNATLTDGRSRWYGIGPECEKHWPHVLQEIEDRKGAFAGVR